MRHAAEVYDLRHLRLLTPWVWCQLSALGQEYKLMQGWFVHDALMAALLVMLLCASLPQHPPRYPLCPP